MKRHRSMRSERPSREKLRIHGSIFSQATGSGNGTTSRRSAAPPEAAHAAVVIAISRSASLYRRPTESPFINRAISQPASDPCELAICRPRCRRINSTISTSGTPPLRSRAIAFDIVQRSPLRSPSHSRLRCSAFRL